MTVNNFKFYLRTFMILGFIFLFGWAHCLHIGEMHRSILEKIRSPNLWRNFHTFQMVSGYIESPEMRKIRYSSSTLIIDDVK